MKKTLIFLLCLFFAAGFGVWYLRGDIIRFAADIFFKKVIPGNVVVEKVVLDLSGGKLELYNLAVRNPAGFQDLYFADVPFLSISFRMRGRTVLSGVEVTGLELKDPVVSMERLSNGRANFDEIEMAPPGGSMSASPKFEIRNSSSEGAAAGGEGMVKSVSEAVVLRGHLPGSMTGGKIIFRDAMIQPGPFFVTLERMESAFRFLLDDYEVTYLETEGHGFVNGDDSQRLNWRVSADLAASKITMSNRIEPQNVDITFFKPYYDRYSPIDITRGKVSGVVVFDLNAGNIGSDNSLTFRGLEFKEKQGGSSSVFWDANMTEIIKYLELSPGETVFDFKIKGPMENPRFYPGPNVSRAIRNMAVDKIGEMISKATNPEKTATQEEAARTDVDKVLEVFSELMKK